MTILELAGFGLATIGSLGLGWACWMQRREIERLRDDIETELDRVEMWERSAHGWSKAIVTYEIALSAIAAATRDGKSGTAKRIHRMAMEGLNDN